MSTACGINTMATLDYSPSVLNLTGLKKGFSYSDYIEFFDESGVAEDITGDTFTMLISDASLSLVATLVLPGGLLVGGLEIDGTNKLQYLISSPVTDISGVYTFILILTDSSNGNDFPIVVGKIIVKP